MESELRRVLQLSLNGLADCKDKLIEFQKEPLIVPIFNDVRWYVQEL